MLRVRWMIMALGIVFFFAGTLLGCSSDETPAAQLLGITVQPESAKIVVDESKQFQAIGQFSDGSTRNISAEVVWHSTNESVATIDASGLATGISEGGSTLITATAGNLSSDPPALLEVVDESNRLVSITLEPPTAQIQLGASLSFAAMGTFMNGSSREITEEVIWESTNPTIVSISNNPGSKGVAIGLASGGAEISARIDDVTSGLAPVTVTEVALLSISISPSDPTLPLGTVQQFKATGTYSDNSTADLTRVVTWMSSNKVVADFSAQAGEEGYCSAFAEGTTSVTAISGSVISDPVTLSVTAATLQEITIEPAAPSVPVGAQIQFSAMGRYSDDQLLDITQLVTWNTSDDTKVDFDDQHAGRANGLAVGSAEIWASFTGIDSAHVTMSVTSANLESIEISPVNPSLPIGQQQQFTAFGHYSDQNVVDITSLVTWESSDTGVAIISNAAATKGLATGLSDGTTTISAERNGIRGEQTLRVRDIEIVTIVVTPTSASLPAGEHLQYTAMATFNDTSQAEVTQIVTWHVGSTLVADISNGAGDKGQATAVGVGNTTIWCTSSNGVASSPVQLSVTSATLSSITVEPDNPSVVLGSQVNFTATGRFSDGSELPLTTEAVWDSTDTGVATISNTAGSKGVATALSEGTTFISASKDGIDSNSSRLEVVTPTLESIVVTPVDASIAVGETVQYAAMGHYSDDVDRPITELAYWDSSDDTKATVSNAPGTKGVATGSGEGQAQITASYQGVDSPPVIITVTAPVNLQPVAVLTGDPTGTVGVPVAFSGVGSYDTDGSVVNYSFNFGDGTGDHDNGSDSEILHTFTAANTYTVVLTVTDDLGGQGSDSLQISVTETQNEQPHAVLVCPGSGQVGQALEFDASNSYDNDGTIVNYTFNFGDGTGNFDNGSNPSMFHSFTTENTFTVSVTVEDDDGAQAAATCPVAIGATTIPDVRIIRPQGNTDVTQEEQLSVLVDATGQGGFSVTRVVLLADGVEAGEDMTAPYDFDYTVPAGAATGSTITLQAQAYDNNTPPGMGQSQPVFLAVTNYPPVADFTATISGALQVTLDASSCSDQETPTADLEVRWDFDSDGTWDLDWDTNKLLTHTFPADGQYDITMEVRDSVLQTDSTFRTVDLASTQTVGGVLTESTTWYGTIIVTGSVTVPDGIVLNINPGTQILVFYVDGNGDEIGDYGIYVEGSGEIHVNGDSEGEVLFTTYGQDHKVPGAWQGIKVEGSAVSSFDYMTVEYANIGLEMRNASTVSHSVFRFNKEYGLYLYNADGATLTSILSHHNEGAGIYLYGSDNVAMTDITSQDNGTIGLHFSGCSNDTLTTCLVSGNSSHGFYLYNSDIDIEDCSVTQNHAYGMLYEAGSDGSLIHSEVFYNDDVGIRAQSTSSQHPHPTINYNNIYGNSVVAGTSTYVVDTSGVLTVTGFSSAGDHDSAVWTAPDNGVIRRVLVNFYENYYAYGYLLRPDDTQIEYWSSSVNTWRWLDSYNLNGLKVRLNNSYTSSSSTSNSMSVTELEYDARNASGLEMSVAVISGSVNARYNYWGAFPNVLDHISYTRPDGVDIQGFVGVAFDASWDTGPYKAGDLTTENWSDTIYITGDTNVPNGETLTIQAGTQVLFVPIDQDFDGIGDYGIYVDGSMIASGTSGDHVVFTAHGSSPTTASFDKVEVDTSGTSSISYADFSYGNIGLTVGDASSVDNSTFAHNNLYGLYLLDADNCTVDQVTVENNLDVGMRIQAVSGATLSYLDVNNNEGTGIWIESSSSTTLEDSLVQDNTGAGLVLINSDYDIDYCTIRYNGEEGIRYQGGSDGTLAHSYVTYNDLPGLMLRSTSSQHPQPAISYSNLFGNSVDYAVQAISADTSGTLTVTGFSDAGDHDSAVWSIPGNGSIFRVLVNFYENYYAYGYLLQPDNTQIEYWSSSVNTYRWLESYNLTGLKVRLNNSYTSSSSVSNSMSVTQVDYLLEVPNENIELTAATTSGEVSANHVYWGTESAETPDARISQLRALSVDFSSWEMGEVAGCGPR